MYNLKYLCINYLQYLQINKYHQVVDVYKRSLNLSTLQIGLENERFQKLEQAEQRFQQAEDAFNEFQEQIFTKLNGFRDQEINHYSQENYKNKQRKINQLKNRLKKLRIGKSWLQRRSFKMLLKMKVMQEKKENQQVDSIEGIHQGLQNDLQKIQEATRLKANERDESDQNIMKSITDELVKLSNLINVEKRNRDESEQSIFEMLKDIVNRVKQNQIKKKDQQSEEHLLSLLSMAANL
ncbi:unnamed protein product [Paramecium pentaurelia]|uniref:Uncharacterized protein n=1 Tax=Paramecium pentaurelia TaxID=43138 RepID=A0A8S1TZ82_9CILI|nr:unnamed protein product [Paramecium pentaurelia]